VSSSFLSVCSVTHLLTPVLFWRSQQPTSDSADSEEKGKVDGEKTPETFTIQALKLGGCALGLQGSYLTWGVLQEQVRLWSSLSLSQCCDPILCPASPHSGLDHTPPRGFWMVAHPLSMVFGARQIMTQPYGTDKEMFTESQFLVFANRVLAFLTALAITRMSAQPRHTAPLYKYSFTSLRCVNLLSLFVPENCWAWGWFDGGI
jgi:hypothetical protein